MSDALKIFFMLVVVLALIGLIAWALRRFAASRVSTSSGRGRVPRLAVIDAAKVDTRRLLVLVRRDNVEHLLMIGGPTDFVVEANIARTATQGREAPRQPVPDQAWIEPETNIEPMPEPPPRMSRAPLGAEERRPPTMPVPPMPERRPEPMPMPPPMQERRTEPMTGFAPESITRPPQPARVEPPPVRRAEKPAAPPMPAPPVRPPQPPRAEAPPIASPVASSAAEAMSQADKNLAEMAQRLEAALRAPGASPRAEPPPIVPSKVDRVGAPPVAPEAAPARPAPPPIEVAETSADAPAEDAKPATGFESLEAEMASLLGRPKDSLVISAAAARRTFVLGLAALCMMAAPAAAQDISINLGQGGVTERAIQLIALLTVLSVAPSVLIMMTSFTRIVVVLSLLRTALGTATAPPNAVIMALALFLTAFVMGPVLQRSYDEGIRPLIANQITVEQALERGVAPLRGFMQQNVREKDLQLFIDLAKEPPAATPEQMSLRILVPAFMISELKRAFEIGFLLFLPFLIIDLVVASVLMSMGMMMLPPVVVSLPFKLIFFVLVDGWTLVAGSLVQSYGGT